MRYFICFVFLLSFLFSGISQQSITGYVVKDNNIGLPNVSITKTNNRIISSSNENGYFELKINEFDSICFISAGYERRCIRVEINAEKLLRIKLNEKIIVSDDVIVNSKDNRRNIRSIQMGSFELRPDSLRNLPSIAGELDPLNLLKLTPGVSKSEVGMGLIVRGSSSDQNLVIIDGATIYNPTHLAGFLSTFNPMIVEKVTLIKSGIPVCYGGRLSSVTEVESYKNIPEKLQISGNTGILLSSFSIKTPLLKHKVGLFIAARKSYIDYTIKPISRIAFHDKRSMFAQTDYSFYDINLGLTIVPTENDRIYINSYLGNDDFVLFKSSFELNNNMSWGNQNVSIRWMRHFSEKHVMKTVVSYTNNAFHLYLGQNDFLFDLSSNLTDYNLVHEHTFYSENNTFKFGIQALKQYVLPNKSQAMLNSLKANFGTPNDFKTATISLYAQTDYTLNSKIALSAGIRFNRYYHLGPYEQYLRNNNQEIIDTIQISKNSVVKSYTNIESLIALRYIINTATSLKLSLNQNFQYLQQVNVSAVALPTDFWIPASTNLKPLYGIQGSVGYYKNYDGNLFESSVELFYKHMQNLTEFKKNFLSSVTRATMEENLIFGQGRAYGIEFLLRKNDGAITGWISYALSRTERIFADINNGKVFPAKYDRTHDVSLVAQYKLNEKWSTSAVFIFTTGNAVTLPIGRYMINNSILNQYTEYNSFRMPAYHRLDISFTRILKQKGRWEHKLHFNVYNVYSRLNPYYMFFALDGDIYHLKVTPKFVALFPIIPSISYEFKF
jgi:hypothetical protein